MTETGKAPDILQDQKQRNHSPELSHPHPCARRETDTSRGERAPPQPMGHDSAKPGGLLE